MRYKFYTMDSSQEDHYGMYLKVDFFLVARATDLAFNPAIATTRTSLNTLINSIAQADSTATRNITGYTIAKNEHREAQLTQFKLVRAALMGYFTANPDIRKKKLIDFNDSDIDRFRNDELYAKTDQLLDVALPVKALLVPFGVAAADVDALNTMNDAWNMIEPSNRMEQAVNIAALKDVNILMPKVEDLLHNTLDSYLKVVQYTNPNIYSQYQTARMIDDSGGGSDSAGYDVQNLTVPPNGSLLFDIGSSGIPADLSVYLRAINGSLKVCTTNLPAGACTDGFDLVQGETFKGNFKELGLDDTKTNIQFTNNSPVVVALRAGVKTA